VAGVVDKTAGVFQSEEGKSASGHKKKVYPININDKGGASRFFYQAKVSKSERNMSGKCSHPTLKPIQLMSYLCKLVTPPGGIILDPFSGSGSTGIAALLNDFRFVGMELEQEYFDIMEKRVNDYESYRKFLKK
jgi:DNA modification methylase